MSSNPYYEDLYQNNPEKKKNKNNYLLHIALFAVTFVTCMIAGTQWAAKDFVEVMNWHYGLEYAVLIMTFLTAHEFGHYFASKYHKVDASLPYYIPFVFPVTVNFGTFGALIKTRSPIMTRKALFDIGVAGPVAGFIISIGFLIYGLLTLPGIDFIYTVHPEYLAKFHGEIPTKGFFFGSTLLYDGLARIFANPKGWLPPLNEIYHYPFLNVGWFGLFVTTLNLLPFGQLDGGHIMKAMFGPLQGKIARWAWSFLIFIGLFSMLGLLREILADNYSSQFMIYLQNAILPLLNQLDSLAPWLMKGWSGWLVWALISRIVVKLDHPQVYDETALGKGRMLLGYLSILILILSFSFQGLYFIE